MAFLGRISCGTCVLPVPLTPFPWPAEPLDDPVVLDKCWGLPGWPGGDLACAQEPVQFMLGFKPGCLALLVWSIQQLLAQFWLLLLHAHWAHSLWVGDPQHRTWKVTRLSPGRRTSRGSLGSTCPAYSRHAWPWEKRYTALASSSWEVRSSAT